MQNEKAAHTPGPWTQNPGPDTDNEDHKRANQLYVRLGTGSANAVIERQNVFGKVTDEDLANAKLIAAAPELLKACKQMLGYIEMTLAHEGCMNVSQIMERLKQVRECTAEVETSHHLGCKETTRRADLSAARIAIAKATI